ncbi:MAG TPA: AAA family ATPase [Candidatus Dormibacteraeota bacterium]|nr:AAA family ATPase [Candidatus Dormibacteraeota bacterium]
MRRAGLSETHCSVVVFAGDRAYKLKKPVKFAFLDFSTRAAREVACRREVELNRRIAPDVYLGVADVVGPEGTVCDHLVVMRRMPEERRLATLVERGTPVTEDLRRIARTVAAFHARAETSPEIAAAATRDAVLANWEQSFREMRPFYGSLLDHEAAMRVEVLVRRYLAGRQRLFDERIAHGFVRDGHGDLKSEDIFCLDDYPRILDCLEFDDRLRHGDVLADVAFLAMDLERLGLPKEAERFLGWYEEFSGTHAPTSLRHHYIAYRAHIRAKVACLRRAQGAEGGEDPAQLLELTRRHLEKSLVALVLVGGLPGTGKSTLAAAVGQAKGWAVLRSDEIRKQQGRLGASDPALAPWESGLYTPARTRATYEELLRRACIALERGESVILDASWHDPQWRLAAARVAAETYSDLVALHCQAPSAIASARLAARKQGGDASDASPETHARMAPLFAAWPRATTIDTTVEPTASVASALEAITFDAVVSALLPSEEPYPAPVTAAS